MLKKYQNNNYGFTLAEIMVSIAVITIFSTISFASFTSYKRQGAIDAAAQKLTSDFRKIQGYALSLKEFNSGAGFVIPKGGWGMYMRTQPASENKNYIAFADYDTPYQTYQSSAEYFFNYSLVDAHISDIKLEQSNHTVISRNQANITFEPPVPTVHICANNASDCDYISVQIELVSDTSEATSTVYINNVGLVDAH